MRIFIRIYVICGTTRYYLKDCDSLFVRYKTIMAFTFVFYVASVTPKLKTRDVMCVLRPRFLLEQICQSDPIITRQSKDGLYPPPLIFVEHFVFLPT